MSQRFNSVVLKQSVVTLTATVDNTIVAANPLRKYLAIVNIGTGLVTLAFDQAAVAGSGWPLAAAGGAGQQGGAIVFEASALPMNAIHAISTAGSSVVVIEGV
jgi:hypothetical protein